jgi:hypothetical protein
MLENICSMFKPAVKYSNDANEDNIGEMRETGT